MRSIPGTSAELARERLRVPDPIARRLRSHFCFAALLAILFLTFLDNTVISAALADVQSQLHSGVTELQWVVGGYALTFASLMLICGSLGDNFGRKKVMLLGVVVFCAGSVVCALATTSAALVAGRVIMGAGAAGSEPATLSMIRHIYPDHRRRARALGAWAAVSGFALAMGPVLGGTLVGLWSWRAIFWFNLLFGVLALAVAGVALPESVNERRQRLDLGGFVLSTLAIGTATYATIAGETSGYRSGEAISLYAVSLVALVLFCVVERRVAHPMLNLSFFSRPPFAGATFVAFCSYFAIFAIFFFVALYLVVVASVGSYELALNFIPLLGGMVAASLFAGRWVGRVGSRTPMTVGCLLAAAGVLLTNAVISPTVGPGTLGWTMGLAGLGFGILVVPVNAVALRTFPAEHSGMASSTINTSRELGAVAGVAILGSIVNGELTVHLTERLAQIGIPPQYRAEVITAVTTGTVNAKAKDLLATSSATVRTIIERIVAAAYSAFSHGLTLALTISGVLLLASAVVAVTTGTSRFAEALGGEEHSTEAEDGR